MNRGTQKVMNGLIKNVQYADVVPFNDKEAELLSSMAIGHYACGNMEAFAVGVGTLTKVNRNEALKAEIIEANMNAIKQMFPERFGAVSNVTPSTPHVVATGTNGP